MTRVTELTPLLKRLQLGPMAATLPERITPSRLRPPPTYLDHHITRPQRVMPR